MNDKKKKMLDAAGELFSKKGYYNTSMKDVADLAGIAVGTIYLYFKDKENLLDGIYDYASTLLLEQIERELAKQDHPLRKLSCFVRESIDFGLKHPYYFLIVFVDFRRQAAEFPKSIMYSFFHRYLAIGNAIIDELRRQGLIVGGNDVLYGITGFWGAYVLREIFQPGFAKLSRRKKRDEIFQLCRESALQGFLATNPDNNRHFEENSI